jgi:hypothetical protein
VEAAGMKNVSNRMRRKIIDFMHLWRFIGHPGMAISGLIRSVGPANQIIPGRRLKAIRIEPAFWEF